VHPDIRSITEGGSLVEDKLEQAKAAGCILVLAFMMLLYPRETVSAMRFAKSLGLEVALVTDSTFANHRDLADYLLRGRINSGLVSDSYATFSVLVAALVDSTCDAMGAMHKLASMQSTVPQSDARCLPPRA
jgi:DNA-binding MurR/RpiR family transcriptional regulator